MIIFAFAFLAGTGCSLHKSNIQKSMIKTPNSFSTEGKGPGPVIGKWWERFEDKKLNILMNEAFQYNLDIAQSHERLKQSMAIARITGSSGGVALNISGSGGRAQQPGASGPVTADSYNLSAAASYELDLWGKIKSATSAAELNALASEQDLEAMYISTSARLADLYYLAVEQRAQLEFADRTIASLQETLESVERRYNGGLVPAIDVYQSRQVLAAAKSRRPPFESTLAVTLNAISVMVGRFPDKEIGGDMKNLIDVAFLEAGVPSQLLTRRPDVKAAFMRLKARDENVSSAISDRFPSFSLTGTYGGASDQLSEILDSPNIFWNILLQAVQPVLDAGRRKAEVHRTEAVLRESLIVYHRTVLDAFKEVEDALVKMNTSKERIGLLEETVSISENTLRLALERYMQGLTDYQPVLSGQQQHFNAESSLLAARRQLISDRIQFVRSLGGDWVHKVRNNQKIQEFRDLNKTDPKLTSRTF